MLADNEPWRTEYLAFHEQLQQSIVESRYGDEALDVQDLDLNRLGNFGFAIQLQWSASDQGDDAGRGAEMYRESMAPEQIGEVLWEATITSVPERPGDLVGFDLEPAPEPLAVEFYLDQNGETGDWESLEPGQTVRFIGRLTDELTRPTIAFYVRFPGNVPGGGPAEPGFRPDRFSPTPAVPGK